MKKNHYKEHYKNVVREELKKKFGYTNPHNIPRLSKIIVSMGLADASSDKKLFQYCVDELGLITGQKPFVTRATKSISNFKLREGQTIGAKVTLRGDRMYHFLYKFNNIAAPRIPDFRGLKKKGDGRGNYSLGLKDQTMFPEVNLDKVLKTQGMNITIVTTATSDEECHALLSQLAVPFKKNTSN